MKGLTVLFHPDFGEIRSTATSGEIWFIAKDVCDILGITNSRKALTALDNDEKGVTISDTLGGKQEMATINESGLYHLIFISRKTEAQQFRKWVTHDVLPSIRKNGFYIHPSLKLTLAQQRRLNLTMRNLLEEYLTDHDIMRCAKRCGRTAYYVRDVLSGYQQNRGIMDELQSIAIKNKGQLGNPYSTERIREVVKELSK